jgi:hypothetical protein
MGRWKIEIIKGSEEITGFEVLPRRWVIERTFTWLERCRRLAKDFEATIQSVAVCVFVAQIRTLTRKTRKGLMSLHSFRVTWVDWGRPPDGCSGQVVRKWSVTAGLRPTATRARAMKRL